MDVSIIIVNYNTKNLTLQCIDSIYEKTIGVSFEIIIVDNNSTDGSQELLSQDNRIVFVEAGENLGFGKANNLGVEKSNGKFIFFLNSDTILVNNAINIIVFIFLSSFHRFQAYVTSQTLLHICPDSVHVTVCYLFLLPYYNHFVHD